MSNIVPQQSVEYKGQRVLTTEQLAESFGTTPKIISQNYNRNKKQYVEEIDFFLLTGDDLKNFMSIPQFEELITLNRLYLWTESGALLHAKSLNTPEAWNVYRALRDHYFQSKEIIATLQVQLIALQQENLQLRAAQAPLLLPERITDKEAGEIMSQLAGMYKNQQLGNGLIGGRQDRIAYALEKARMLSRGGNKQYFTPENVDEDGNMLPCEYPPDED